MFNPADNNVKLVKSDGVSKEMEDNVALYKSMMGILLCLLDLILLKQ